MLHIVFGAWLKRGGEPVTVPLRIGILGAARIADEGIVGPAG
jgi:hypothetical protein